MKKVNVLWVVAVLSLTALSSSYVYAGGLPVGKEAAESAKSAPASAGEEILVDDFEIGQTSGLFAERKNRLDAFQGTWARRPSSTVITKVPDTKQGRKGQVLRIEFNKLGGWCGWYTLLNGIDVSKHNALVFWVKGEKGGERFDIGLADDQMQEREIDAVYVGTIKAFLPAGVTNQWQKVIVPIASLRSELDLTRMGSLVFWFRYEGTGAVQIDDIKFVNDPEVTKLQEYNMPRATAVPGISRSMWLWKLDVVGLDQVRKDFFDFCQQTAINHVFLFLGESPITQTDQKFQEQLSQFLQECHKRNIRIDALTGNPLWAKRENHQVLLDWIKSFLELNTQLPKDGQVDGVHLDVEPYLLTEWEQNKEPLKEQYVELMKKIRELINSFKQPNFQLGIAVPIFYDKEGDFERKVLENVDYVGLMDYYDSAIDIIEKGNYHVKLASEVGKKMVIGVETQDLVQMAQGKRRNTFHEEGWEEMEQQLSKVIENFKNEKGFGGVAIHCYESYRLLQRGRNVPTRDRPEQIYEVPSILRTEELVMDGNLEEWQKLKPLVVDKKTNVVYGVGAWKGPQDLSYKMWSQWDEDALYLAFEMSDDTLVQERTKGDMWEGDHIELWIDADLYGDYNEAMNSSDDFQFGLSPGNFNNIPPEVFVWVPAIAPGYEKRIKIGAQKLEKGYTMEVRIPATLLIEAAQHRVGVEPQEGGKPKTQQPAMEKADGVAEEVFQAKKLKPGFAMGIMVDASDCDNPNQPQKSLVSTSKDRIWGDPTTFGILKLTDKVEAPKENE